MHPSEYTPCIYLATNIANGSIYIGKSMMGLHRRMKTHLSAARNGAKQPFPCALRKYGPDGFTWKTIYHAKTNEALIAAEVALIVAYKAAGFRMYNATEGGEGASRKKSEAELAEMRLRRISDTHKNQLRASWTPERRAAQAEKMRNRVVTAEDRKRMSEARKGMKFSPEHCESIRISKLGNQCRKGTGRA